MKNIAKVTVLALVIMLTAIGCKKNSSYSSVGSITMLPDQLSLIEGESYQLLLIAEEDDDDIWDWKGRGDTTANESSTYSPTMSDNGVVWITSCPSVASVSSKGLVKALKAGKATITAYYYGHQATCRLTVTAPDPTPQTSTTDTTSVTPTDTTSVPPADTTSSGKWRR